jgi:hypothetical protein
VFFSGYSSFLHDITEILLKVALNTITPPKNYMVTRELFDFQFQKMFYFQETLHTNMNRWFAKQHKEKTKILNLAYSH